MAIPTIEATLNLLDQMHKHCTRLRNENLALKQLVREFLSMGSCAVPEADGRRYTRLEEEANELLKGNVTAAELQGV